MHVVHLQEMYMCHPHVLPKDKSFPHAGDKSHSKVSLSLSLSFDFCASLILSKVGIIPS